MTFEVKRHLMKNIRDYIVNILIKIGSNMLERKKLKSRNHLVPELFREIY